jgi:hypothetical protein
MQEKPHVIYLLNLLRGHIPAPTDGSGPPRLPYVCIPNTVSRDTRDILPVQLYLSSHRPVLVTTGGAGCSRYSHVPRDAL